jgi:hypothetical protein
MAKEQLQKLHELAEKRTALSGIVSQNERLLTNVDAPLGEGGFTVNPPKTKVTPGSSLDEALRVGRYNKNLPEERKRREQTLKDTISASTTSHLKELEEVDHQLEELAPDYAKALNVLTEEITELSELAADPDSGITEEVFRNYYTEFENFASLPDQIPPLKRGVEKLDEDPEPASGGSRPHPGLLVDALDFPPFAQQGATRPPATTAKPPSNLKPARFPTALLDAYYRGEDPTDPETKKTKVRIYLLSDNQLKIGNRAIKASAKHAETHKDYSEERIKVLKVLIANQGRLFDSRELWNEAFPNEQFNQRALAQIKVWLDKFITHRGAPVIYHNGKRGLASRYGITRFDVELIEPGKKTKTNEPATAKAEKSVEKPFAPKTKDVYQLTDGAEIRGIRARLARIFIDELSNPMLYITSNDLAIMVTGSNDKAAKDRTGDSVHHVRRILREKLGIELASSYQKGSFEKQEVKYWVIRPDDEIADALRGSVRLVPPPKGKVAEKLLYGEKPAATEPAEKPTSTKPELIEPVEDERLNIIPSIEEATLLVGYFKFNENIFEEIGINPPPDNMRDKLEHALGDKNGRNEVDILELRQNGFQKIKKLIKEDILSVVLDELDANDPRFDFLRYFKDFESLQIEYERIGSTMPHHISVIDFLDMWLNSQIDLTKVTNIRNYIRAEEIDDKETAKDDIQTGAEILFEAAPPAHDTVTEAGGITPPEIGEETEEFARTEEVTVFLTDEDAPSAELKEIEKQFTGIREKISGVVDLVHGHSELNQGLKRREISSYFIGISQKDIDRAINRQYIDVDTIFNRKNRPGQSDHLNPAAVATLAILKELPQELPRNLKLEIKELVAEEFEKRRENNSAVLTPVSTDEAEEILAQTADMTETDLAVDIESILNDLYDQVQGLNSAGVSFRAVRGRFPNLKAKHLRNAFERNILPENLPGGPGGVQLDHDAIVTLQFYYANERNFDSPYFKRTFEQIKKKVKRERENRPTDPKDRFIEG